MKYLNKEQLARLTREQLDQYMLDMSNTQELILEMIDEWTQQYDLVIAEASKRGPSKSIIMNNDSDTIH